MSKIKFCMSVFCPPGQSVCLVSLVFLIKRLSVVTFSKKKICRPGTLFFACPASHGQAVSPASLVFLSPAVYLAGQSVGPVGLGFLIKRLRVVNLKKVPFGRSSWPGFPYKEAQSGGHLKKKVLQVCFLPVRPVSRPS